MANETVIRPALTESEWDADPELDRPNLLAYTADDDLLVARTPGDRSVLASGEDRHALAALALYGQSFGFSEDDIRALRALTAYYPIGEVRDAGRALAAKLAALLPPTHSSSSG